MMTVTVGDDDDATLMMTGQQKKRNTQEQRTKVTEHDRNEDKNKTCTLTLLLPSKTSLLA